MKLIVITTPYFFEGESLLLSHLFQEGMERLHLRKPQSKKADFIRLLETIPAKFHSRIVLHDHFDLVSTYPVGGIHLNSRNNRIPLKYKGCISCSCHSLQEVEENRQLDYVFLSPVFQSISKEGYGNGFPIETLLAASEQGIINENVIALGGMDQTTIPLLRSIHFGGVAVLGALWGKEPELSSVNTIINRYKTLLACTKNMPVSKI